VTEEGRASFLKKRSKKLLSMLAAGALAFGLGMETLFYRVFRRDCAGIDGLMPAAQGKCYQLMALATAASRMFFCFFFYEKKKRLLGLIDFRVALS
jgi:hypothetical protein